MSNRIVSDDTKKKMSEAARNRPKREVSDETREKLKFARAKRNLTKQPKVQQSRITLTPEEKEQIRILKNSMPRSLKARNKYAQAFYIC
jgi:NAD(P)H-hydrate repair Nnr-like enzyme with NAD(P)H-hydrate dehydratase domain